jgi:hypothetical protein
VGPGDARRIQSQADKIGTNQNFKARSQRGQAKKSGDKSKKWRWCRMFDYAFLGA